MKEIANMYNNKHKEEAENILGKENIVYFTDPNRKWEHIGTIEPIKYTGDRNPEELLSFINGCIITYPKSNGYKYIDMNGDIVEYIRKLLSTDPIKSSIAILNHSKISN